MRIGLDLNQLGLNDLGLDGGRLYLAVRSCLLYLVLNLGFDLMFEIRLRFKLDRKSVV